MRGRKEAEILAKTFQDHLTVRRTRMQVDPQTKESIEIPEIVYRDIPCALSKAGSAAPELDLHYGKRQADLVLFTRPGDILQANDEALVVTEAGQSYCLRTGETFAYISHGETPAVLEGLA